jgi:hypothetical protein
MLDPLTLAVQTFTAQVVAFLPGLVAAILVFVLGNHS